VVFLIFVVALLAPAAFAGSCAETKMPPPSNAAIPTRQSPILVSNRPNRISPSGNIAGPQARESPQYNTEADSTRFQPPTPEKFPPALPPQKQKALDLSRRSKATFLSLRLTIISAERAHPLPLLTWDRFFPRLAAHRSASPVRPTAPVLEPHLPHGAPTPGKFLTARSHWCSCFFA